MVVQHSILLVRSVFIPIRYQGQVPVTLWCTNGDVIYTGTTNGRLLHNTLHVHVHSCCRIYQRCPHSIWAVWFANLPLRNVLGEPSCTNGYHWLHDCPRIKLYMYVLKPLVHQRQLQVHVLFLGTSDWYGPRTH